MRAILTCLLVLLATVSASAADEFDPMNLIGEWEGEGSFIVPVTELEVEIEGAGEFVYDSSRGLIKTSMSGTKYFLNYADSGLLIHHPETDSVSWEVWDNWGKHAFYWGIIDGDMLRADRIHRSKDYRVTVEFPHSDTLLFRLTVGNDDSTRTDKARFRLWRKK